MTDTSKKYGLTIIGVWTVTLISIMAFVLHLNHQDTLEEAANQARDYIKLSLSFRTWNDQLGGVYAPVERVAPNPFLQVPHRDVTTADGRQLTLVNPFYMTRMVFETIRQESSQPIISKLTSLTPLNPVNAPDPWERRMLETISQGRSRELFQATTIDGSPYLRMVIGFVTEAECLACHKNQGYRVGDSRTGISIAVPLPPYLERETRTGKFIVGGFLLLWMTGSAGVAVLSRKRFYQEAALRQSEERFRRIFDSNMIAITFWGADGRFSEANQAFGNLLGYTPAEIRQGTLHWNELTPPELLDRDQKAIDEIRATGVCTPYEKQFIHRSGRRAPVLIGAAMLQGMMDQGVAFAIDLTGIKETERKLHDSNQMLQAMIDASPVAIIALDAAANVTMWSPAAERIFGWKEEEVLGGTVPTIPEEMQDDFWENLQQILSGQTVTGQEVRRLRKDGARIDVSISTAPIHDVDGSVIGALGIMYDITDRKKSEAERLDMERHLLHTQKLESLGVLAGGIAHDFNNLLVAMLGNLDLAVQRLPGASPAQTSIDKAIQACRSAEELTRQMLAYSGQGQFEVKEIDLSTVVQENVDLFRTTTARNVSLQIVTAPDLPLITADPGQLQQVVMNLITNASESMESGSGVITLTTGIQECDETYLSRSRLEVKPPAGWYVYVEVSDTGCGMSPETQRRLFEPFFTTKFTGRGLGMSAVLGIIRSHGGAILVESEAGRGSTFRVLFPVSDKERRHPRKVAEPTERRQNSQAFSGTVLVVDDEEIVRNLFIDSLQYLGFQVIEAADGSEGVKRFQEHADDICFVLLDLTMPTLDGVRTFQELKRLRPDVRVILCSGYREQNVAEQFTHERPAGFLQKPFLLEELKNKISEVLSGGR